MNADVAKTMDSVTGELTDSGVTSGEMAGEMGSTISRSSASEQAGADAVKGSKGYVKCLFK